MCWLWEQLSTVPTLGKRLDSGSLPLAAEPHLDTPWVHIAIFHLQRAQESPSRSLCDFCRQHHTRRAVLSLCTFPAQRLPFEHGPDWRSRPIDRVSEYHPSTDRPLPLGAIGRGDQTKPPRLPATSWTLSRRIPQDLCGPSQPFRPERIKPAVSTLATHRPPSTQLLPSALSCPDSALSCLVLPCPALPCQRQRTTASHSDPRVPRVGTAKGVSCPLLYYYFFVRTPCQSQLRYSPQGAAVEVESSRPRSGIYGVSPWCAISSLIRTSNLARCRLGQGLLLGLIDLQTNITCRADCLPARR